MEDYRIPHKNLTKREMIVIKLVALGFENNEIAEKLGVSIHTVKAFVANILRKLDARNRTNAVFIAFQNGILEDKDKLFKSV